MANNTSINWTDLSSNLIRAKRKDTGKVGHFCTKKNSKCVNCYAEAINKYVGNGLAYDPRNRSNIEYFFAEKEAENLLKLNASLRNKGLTKKVFLGSMTDIFHEWVPFELIDKVYELINECESLIFQTLTKRVDVALKWIDKRKIQQLPVNNWFGLTPEDDGSDIPTLIEIPVRLAWLSLEPLLTNIDLLYYLSKCDCEERPSMSSKWRFTGESWEHHHGYPIGHVAASFTSDIKFIVVGGESGTKARVTNINHIKSVVYQSKLLNIPVWVKQLGKIPMMSESEWRKNPITRLLNAKNHKKVPSGFVPLLMSDSKGGKIEEFPIDLQVREFPK